MFEDFQRKQPGKLVQSHRERESEMDSLVIQVQAVNESRQSRAEIVKAIRIGILQGVMHRNEQVRGLCELDSFRVKQGL